MAVLDRNTMKEVAASGAVGRDYQKQDFDQTQVSGPQSSMGVTNTNQVATTNQTQATSSYALNTTPEILAALHSFISTMQDRPRITAQELDATAPLPVKQFQAAGGGQSYVGAFGSPTAPQGGGQFVYVDPKTGQQLTEQQAAKLTAERTRQREQLTAEAGIIKGGTVEQQTQQAERAREIARNRETQGKYSKEAAITDAQGLSNYFARVLSEQQMPGILRAAEGSGASQGTTRALLTQQAIQRTGEVATKAGLDAAVAYGGINNQLASVLEALTRSDPNSVSAQLLQAFQVGKGISQNQSGLTNVSGTTNTVGTQVQQQVKSGEVQDTRRVYHDEGQVPLNNLGGPVAPIVSANPRVYEYTVHSRAPVEALQTGVAPANEDVAYDTGDNYNFF